VSLNKHHRGAVRVFGLAVSLDIIFGIVFSFAEHVSTAEGLYYATATATTVGADIQPRGWLAHVLTVAMMATIIPLFAATFSLLTTGLTADHIDRKHDDMKRHVSREAARS